MSILEILYDHYNQTFNLSKKAQTRRNKNFIILCLLEALSFLLLVRPEKAFDLILAGINKELNATLQLSNTIIQTLIWLLIAYVVIRYIQDMLYIERQYIYLSSLEKKISNLISIDIFTREGDNYQKDYPMVLNFIDLFYKMLMPILFILINIIRIYVEWTSLNEVTIALICDTILFISIFIINWFYFFEIHSEITNYFKENIPIINKIAKVLRTILYKV